jgi:hypothetical protein
MTWWMIALIVPVTPNLNQKLPPRRRLHFQMVLDPLALRLGQPLATGQRSMIFRFVLASIVEQRLASNIAVAVRFVESSVRHNKPDNRRRRDAGIDRDMAYQFPAPLFA